MRTILIISENKEEREELKKELSKKNSVVIKERGQAGVDFLKKADALPDTSLNGARRQTKKGDKTTGTAGSTGERGYVRQERQPNQCSHRTSTGNRVVICLKNPEKAEKTV